ncbi:MAG TPA: hypothetical protein V6C84_00930 [Coleofasciculaceae cyanobacterium]|jgi:hypothetical protein
MKWTWRIVWITSLVALWLFCSGVAQADPLSLYQMGEIGETSLQEASPLASRLAQYPNWRGKPLVQPSRGDLVYPEWFQGNWTVTTTLLDMTAPLAPDITTPGFESNRQFLNQPIAFKVRFVEAEAKGIDALNALFALVLNRGEKQIVSDRAFNGMSLAKAYLGDRAILAVKVDPNNPNRQITLLRGDSPDALFSERQLVSTVIGRAVEAPTSDRFITTEVFQQEFRGTPQIYFNEVENTTAYSHHTAELDAGVAIEADQVTAIYLSPQDPNYFKTIPNGSFLGEPQPVALYRYRLEFTRDSE